MIHCHGPLTAILAKWTTAVPVVYTEHDATPWMCHYRRWWERWIRKAIYRTLNVAAFRRVDRIVTNCEALVQELTGRWGIPEERSTYIRNGIDIDGLTVAGGGRPSVSEELGIPGYCLFVGRLNVRKAPDVLAPALAMSPGHHLCPGRRGARTTGAGGARTGAGRRSTASGSPATSRRPTGRATRRRTPGVAILLGRPRRGSSSRPWHAVPRWWRAASAASRPSSRIG